MPTVRVTPRLPTVTCAPRTPTERLGPERDRFTETPGKGRRARGDGAACPLVSAGGSGGLWPYFRLRRGSRGRNVGIGKSGRVRRGVAGAMRPEPSAGEHR